MLDILNCLCCKAPVNHKDYISHFLGTDETDGRFARVSLETCRHCGVLWLVYGFEIEGISQSGRWFRCPVTAENMQNLSADNALSFLENSDQTYCGGSYFDGKIGQWHGKINL